MSLGAHSSNMRLLDTHFWTTLLYNLPLLLIIIITSLDNSFILAGSSTQTSVTSFSNRSDVSDSGTKKTTIDGEFTVSSPTRVESDNPDKEKERSLDEGKSNTKKPLQNVSKFDSKLDARQQSPQSLQNQSSTNPSDEEGSTEQVTEFSVTPSRPSRRSGKSGLPGKPGDRSKDKSSDRSTDKPGDKPKDKASDRTVDKPGEKPSDKSTEKSGERQRDKSKDRLGELQTGDKPKEKSGEKLNDKQAERQGDKQSNKSGEKSGDKLGEKSARGKPCSGPSCPSGQQSGNDTGSGGVTGKGITSRQSQGIETAMRSEHQHGNSNVQGDNSGVPSSNQDEVSSDGQGPGSGSKQNDGPSSGHGQESNHGEGSSHGQESSYGQDFDHSQGPNRAPGSSSNNEAGSGQTNGPSEKQGVIHIQGSNHPQNSGHGSPHGYVSSYIPANQGKGLGYGQMPVHGPGQESGQFSNPGSGPSNGNRPVLGQGSNFNQGNGPGLSHGHIPSHGNVPAMGHGPGPNQGQGQGIPSQDHVTNIFPEDKFQFAVSIRVADDPERPHGSGAIIHPQWILTTRRIATEIQYAYPPTLRRVYPLVVYPKYTEDFRSLTNHKGYKVDRSFCFPYNYSEYGAHEDPALLKLEKPLPINDPHNPFEFEKIDMVDFNFDPSAIKHYTIGGWTLFREPPDYIPNMFQKLTIRTVPIEGCINKMKNSNLPPLTPQQRFCSRDYSGISCKDLSGSPIIMKPTRTKKFLAGFVAFFGTECDEDSDRRTSLAPFRPWIDEVFRKEDQYYDCKNVIKTPICKSGPCDQDLSKSIQEAASLNYKG